MQPLQVALRRQDNELRALAGRYGAGELGDRAGGVSRGRGAQYPVDGELGGVADDCFHVAGIDLLLAGGIKSELLDLAARQRPVGADAGEQQVARVGRDREAVAAQRVADQRLEIVHLVGIAGDRRRLRRLLKQRAQRIGGAQIAGFHDEGRRERAAVDERLQRGRSDAPASRRAHDLGAAEHRHRLRFDGEAVGIGVEIGVIEANDLPGRRFALGNERSQAAGALGHEAGIGAVEQHGCDARPRRLQKRLSLVGLYGDHGSTTDEV